VQPATLLVRARKTEEVISSNYARSPKFTAILGATPVKVKSQEGKRINTEVTGINCVAHQYKPFQQKAGQTLIFANNELW
jgi:hypothetical protein